MILQNMTSFSNLGSIVDEQNRSNIFGACT